MADSRIVKRYNAYYHGWCLAFGEHEMSYDEGRDINWLFGEDRIGLVLSARLRRRLFRELLGHHEQIPHLRLSDESVAINRFVYPLSEPSNRYGNGLLRKFLLGADELHLFLCSHFCYPPGTRIITFAKKRPLMIMYKEMQPLRVTIE